ncbi:MAG: hypothetical protein N4A57_16385 [Anaeromicrobium sp.]|jgi:outer membrane lipoprotein-sorting protein|uniref:LolA family protein n=1 Tax=Anaeromicrobium sp. TaxID=1929132 RepID=UPI0025F57BA9|nr:hypothetical protein [Anaeromicrobium sp.]MCT4595826.1 hypothetical protein [Anaeromicrobium sp.]
MKKVLCIIGILLIGLSACAKKTDEEIFYSSQKKLNKMESYSCEIEITSIGNKTPQKYKVRQWFKKPNMYKLEVMKPENLKGKTTLSDGDKTYIYHPQIDQIWMVQRSSKEKNLFLGYFLDNCLKSEDSTIGTKVKDHMEYVVIDTNIPGNHPYYSKERLWIHTKNLKPAYLEIFDNKGNTRIFIEYCKFVYDPKLSEEFFRIK